MVTCTAPWFSSWLKVKTLIITLDHLLINNKNNTYYYRLYKENGNN